MIKRVATGGLILAMGLTAAACGTSEGGSSAGGTSTVADGEPIVVGQALAKTGWMKPYDAALATGARIKAEEINAAGGVKGHQITFVSADTRTDARRSP